MYCLCCEGHKVLDYSYDVGKVNAKYEEKHERAHIEIHKYTHTHTCKNEKKEKNFAQIKNHNCMRF